MPISAEEQVLAAFIAKIAAIPSSTVADLRVEPEWPAAEGVTEDDLPFVAIYEGGLQVTDDVTGERSKIQTVIVEGIATGDSQLAARQALDVLRAEIDKAVTADLTLGVSARDVTPNPEPQPAMIALRASVPVHSFARAYDIEYATAETDPYVIV